jgi:tetratricopeptide (TPR) repeat protein
MPAPHSFQGRRIGDGHRAQPPPRAILALLAWIAAAATLTGCAGTPDPDPRYRPAENVLEVIAVLRRHVPDDTYRFEAAQDFTGRNVYRSSLLRLESMERLHSEALRAAAMDGVVTFAKGRALERLRAFDLAAEAYEVAAALDPALSEEALHSAGVCADISAANNLSIGLDDLAAPAGISADSDSMLESFERRTRRLEELERAEAATHYAFVLREEIERTDLARARYFLALRQILPDGDVRSAGELERVVTRHRKSKRSNHHVLELAQFYETLAVEYVSAHPPESLGFDPVRFRELTDATSRLYEAVAGQDGKPEKLEASRRLEAFLAFALRIDRDRFTQ